MSLRRMAGHARASEPDPAPHGRWMRATWQPRPDGPAASRDRRRFPAAEQPDVVADAPPRL